MSKPKLIKCLPNDHLPIGLEVFVTGQKGKIIEAKDEKDQHGNPIVVHTIRFTHRTTHGNGGKRERLLIKPVDRRVNYSFIYYKPLNEK